MDKEKMAKDLGGGAVFPVGELNTAFAKYFIGNSYLKMFTTERVPIGNVVFEPACRNNWHIHHKGGQILLRTLRSKFPQRALPTSGASPSPTRSITSSAENAPLKDARCKI